MKRNDVFVVHFLFYSEVIASDHCHLKGLKLQNAVGSDS